MSRKGEIWWGWLIIFMPCLLNEYAFENAIFKILVLFYEGHLNIFANSISYMENPEDRGAWWATVQRVAKSWTH